MVTTRGAGHVGSLAHIPGPKNERDAILLG
jgi:hypothetical protein